MKGLHRREILSLLGVYHSKDIKPINKWLEKIGSKKVYADVKKRLSTAVLVDKVYQFCLFFSGRELYPYQEQFARRIIRSVIENDGEEITALFSRQSGKCLAKGTKVLMYDGSLKNVEDIKIGDKVMTPDSSYATVTNLGNGYEEMYEVQPYQGKYESTYTVNKSHILALYDTKTGQYLNMEVSKYLKLSESRKKQLCGYRARIEFKYQETDEDPYEYGYRIASTEGLYDPMDLRLDKQYLINDEIARQELLAGILDACGHFNLNDKRRRNSVAICNVNPIIAEDYLFLLKSLGFRAFLRPIKIKNVHAKDGYKINYRIHASGDFSCIPTKTKQNPSGNCRRGDLIYHIKLKEKGRGEYFGFTIDSKDRLFVLGDFTVTHNTETVACVTCGLQVILPTLANMPMFANDPRLQPFREGIKIGIFAPALQQAQTNYMRMKSFLTSKRAVSILESEEFNLQFSTSNGQTTSLSNGSRCTCFSASERSNIEGESFNFIICEECQDISNFVLTKSISPMGAAYNATKVCIGTATVFKGYFYDAIQRNKELAKNRSSHIKNHFEFDYTIASKYNPNYAKYIEKEKRNLGENSDSFRMSYKLEWIMERGMFIDIDKFEKNNLEPLMDFIDFDREATHVVGIDIGGGSGGDSTVVTVVEVDWDMPVISETRYDEDEGHEYTFDAFNTYVKYFLEIKETPDHEEQYYIITEFLRNFKVARIVVDATREKSFADRLNANVSAEVIPYVFTVGAKSDLYKTFDKELSSGRAKLPASEKAKGTVEYEKCVQQLADLQKNWRGTNLLVSHPETRGAHDDYCLSTDTEILTTRGFLKYNELRSDDLVAKVVNNEIYYVKPNKVIYKDYKGDMYRFSSKDLCLEVTENHKMLTRKRKTGREVEMTSQELYLMPEETRYNTVCIPVAPIQNLKDLDISDDLIQQIAWFITEGWVNKSSKYNSHRYSFSQSVYNSSYNSIESMISRMGLKPYTYTRKDGVTYWTFHKKDNELFDSILTEGIHRIPREWLSNMSQRQLKLLLDTLMLGDGTISRNTYYTKDLGLAQDVQELAHKLGIKTSIRPRYYENGYILYSVYLQSNDETRIKKAEKYYYEGKVWCVNVDNGFIVTRCNNKISVTGNCDSWALAVWGCMQKGEVSEIECRDSRSLFGSPNRRNETPQMKFNRATAKRRRH